MFSALSQNSKKPQSSDTLNASIRRGKCIRRMLYPLKASLFIGAYAVLSKSVVFLRQNLNPLRLFLV